jgi:nitrogen fixation protein NifZ
MIRSTLSFQPGQRIRAAENLFNDGTYSEQLAHALLVRRGEGGDIIRVALNESTGSVVYVVEFALNQIIGCMEWELMPWCSGAKRHGDDLFVSSGHKGLRGFAAA